ncbi:MAG: DnaJ C-terminal domain-containing protein [Telluria sp.]
MEFKDYYATLGVGKTATPDEIKKAYRKLVRKYHPDVSKEADADAKTKELNEAYDVLGNAEKRAAYDELAEGRRHGQQFRPPPDWGEYDSAGVDSDIFADLFAHFGRQRAQQGGFQMRGEDIHAAVTIHLRDAYQGATRTLSLRVPERGADGRMTMRERTLNVNIPKGVMPGQQLRLSGQGHPGSAGPGDLYLEIQFADEARYRVEGRHVYQTVPVAPWEAALGGEINVATPSGAVSVNVPANSQNGRKLRLKGRGIPGEPPGDLYLLLDVVLPPADSEAARDAWRAAARAMPFNPRQNLGA